MFARTSGGWPILPLLLVLSLSLLALLLALAPPVSNDWDSLTYHLAMPKLWLRAGRLIEVPWCDHSYFPALMEQLYLNGLRVSPVAAKLPHYVTFVLALGTIALIGRTFFSRTAGLAGAVVFASIPMVLHEATTAYVDLGLAAYTLLAFYCLLKWMTAEASGKDARASGKDARPTVHYLPLAGVFAGLAMGVKYTGLLVFALLCGWIVFGLWRNRKSQIKNQKSKVRPVVLFAVLAVAIASPWYVKNIVQTGNPVYPFFYDVFGGRGYTKQMADQYKHHQREFGYKRTPANLLASPWRASMWPWHLTDSLEFILTNPGNHKRLYETTVAPPTLGLIGPTLLALLVPLVWLGVAKTGEQRLVLQVLLGTALALGMVWFVLEQYNRYLFPCVALLSVAAGASAGELIERHRLTRIVTLAALTWSAVVASGLMLRYHGSALKVTFGQVSRRDYLFRMSLYAVCDFINQEAPRHARVLLLGEERGFYLDRDYLWGNPGHHTLFPYARMKTAADWQHELRKQRVTHVLINRATVPASDRGWLDAGVREERWRVRYETGADAGYAVYEFTNHADAR